MTTKQFSEEGFRWFVGVVEDRNDPEKRGRVRVRIFGIHEDSKTLVPTDSLPWAPLLMPPMSASVKQVGISPTGLQEGSTVVGFFLDGNETTMPVVFGVMPGKGDVSQLAAGQPLLNKERVGPEPPSAFRAQYPYNKVVQTESGHVFEVDDTPNFQRIHTYHRSGTYQEIDVKGDRVSKIVGDDYEIVVKNKTVFVKGNVNIQVQGNVTLTSPTTNIKGNVNIDGTLTLDGIVMNSHTHGGVRAGGDSTSGPQ